MQIDTTYVTVNDCAPAHLIEGRTVNGNAYFAWDICGHEVFISDTAAEAREKMQRAQEIGTTF